MSEEQQNANQQNANSYPAYPYYYYPQSSPAYYPMYNTRQNPQQTQPIRQIPATPTAPATPGINVPGTLPIQESYIENILRLNLGKLATVYMTFEGSQEKTFKGIVEAAGRDHIILSDPQTDKRYLLLMIYLDYITFDEEINYSYPFMNQGALSSYPPR